MQEKKNKKPYKKIELEEILDNEGEAFDEEDADSITSDTLEFLSLDDETIADYQKARKEKASQKAKTPKKAEASHVTHKPAPPVVYEDEEYEDEEYEDDGYEDEEYEEAEYEDDGYEDEEYEEAEYEDEEYEDEEYEYDEYEDDEYEYEYDSPSSFGEKISYFMRHLSALDVIVAILGIIVLAGVCVTGGLYAGAKQVENQVAAFASIGEEMDGISVIGEGGLIAVAESARLSSMIDMTAEQEQEQEEQETQPQEAETGKEIEVELHITSIQSDMKIKFVNKATGKLIGSVPFEVAVTGSKKSFDLKDEDKDGIIYQTGVEAGTYSVTIKPLNGDMIQEYRLPAAASSVTVSDKIAYQKVDVSDEIKSEAEVNAAAEDTAIQDTVESALTDTVEWVESTKTPLGEAESYEAVDKSNIPDPWTTGSIFRKMVEDGQSEQTPKEVTVTLSSDSLTLSKGETASLSVKVSNTESRYVVEWSSSDSSVATVSDGRVSAVAVGNATITARVAVESMIQELSCQVTVIEAEGEPDKPKDDENQDDGNQDDGNQGDGNKDDGNQSGGNKDDGKKDDGKKDDGKDDNQDNDEPSDKKEYTKISISGGETVEVGKTLSLSAVTEPKNGKVTWSSSDESIAKVDGKGVVTGVAEGTVTIEAMCANPEGVADIYAECEITVKKSVAPSVNGSTELKDKDGNQMYYQDSQGAYHKAVYDDYKTRDTFYKKTTAASGYKYTGWQTIDGHVYFYDKNGNYVTGDQVIQGAKYHFESDGRLSSNSGTLGIDVSRHNGSIDWNAVKNSGVSYVIIRCGYRGSATGVLIEDPKFKSNIQGAKAAGLKVGVYIYSQAVNEVEAVEEASMALNLVKGYGLNYPIFIDVEASGGRGDSVSRDVRTAVCKAFCVTVQNSGYAAGIYSNKNWFSEKINTGSLSGYKIWLAQYASAPTYTATRYDMWQYSSRGRVSGISGDVDMNISYLSY